MVEIYDDRVDIVSPGGVCKGITPENFGTISVTRNPLVQSMFYRIGYIEQMVTGIMRMREAAKDANVAEPMFELENFFKVTFKRTPLDTSSGNGGISGNNGEKKVLDIVQDNDQDKTGVGVLVKKRHIRQERIIEILQDDGAITLDRLAKSLTVSPKTIQRDLVELRNRGRIKRAGSDTSGFWLISNS